jgi:hypothetical protein
LFIYIIVKILKKNINNKKKIQNFVDTWLQKNLPQVKRWQYDDNSGERSIDLFHIHVFVETNPLLKFTPRDGQEYFPPHLLLIDNNNNVGGGAKINK